ncbi:MAG: hypothetical protein ABH983_01155 [Candidatus Micrarchaeota archaeon]
MNSHKTIVTLLLLIGIVSAFNPTDYFYSSESGITISYSNFTLDSTSYSVVSFDGQETFLLKEGEPVSDQAEIESVMYDYYIREYYPSDEDIEELEDLVKKFNDSRNDGYDWKNKEEYLCRDDVLFANGKITVSGKPVTCVDEETCQQNAMLLYAAYGEGLGLGSVDPLYDAIYAFAPSSFAMDHILGNYSDKLSNLDEDSLLDTISYIEGTTGDLKDYSGDIESTIFRSPRRDDQDDKDDCYLKCFGICPSFDLDQDAIDEIDDAIGALSTKIEPLSGYEATSSSIYTQSNSRINYSTTESTAAEYNSKYTSLNSSAELAVSLGDEATLHILNSTLEQNLDSLKGLKVTIPNDIEVRDFSSTADDLDTYEELIGKVHDSSAILLEQYNKTRNANNMLNSLILVLDTKDLDPVSLSSLELLKNQSDDLDAQFHDGIALDDLVSLEEEYKELSVDGQMLLKKESTMPATKVLLLFRGFAKNVNQGIASVAEDTNVLSKEEISENPYLALGGFSTILFLSLGSLLLLAFLYILATSRFIIPKTNHILAAAFASVIVLLLGFSAFTFLFLSKTSSDATLTEFLSDFEEKNETAIFVDLQDTSYSDAIAMKSCASTLASTFTDKNKSWTLYTVDSSKCMLTDSNGQNRSLTLSECQDQYVVEPSSFELGYSTSNEPPKFSIIYENKAKIRANLDYYDSCPIASLFS